MCERSNRRTNLHVPLTDLRFFSSRSIHIAAAATVWNNSPSSTIRSSQTLHIFRKHVKILPSLSVALTEQLSLFSIFFTFLTFFIFVFDDFSTRFNTSRAYMLRRQCPSVCPSVCDGSALWSRCLPGRGEGSSRAMLATARPSCYLARSANLPTGLYILRFYLP